MRKQTDRKGAKKEKKREAKGEGGGGEGGNVFGVPPAKLHQLRLLAILYVNMNLLSRKLIQDIKLICGHDFHKGRHPSVSGWEKKASDIPVIVYRTSLIILCVRG